MGTLKAGLLVWVAAFGVVSFASSAPLTDLEVAWDTTVQSGEVYGTVSVYSPPLPIDAPVVEFYGLAYQLETHDDSIVNVHDGGQVMDVDGPYSPSESNLWDSSTVNVYEGGMFFGAQTASLTLHGTSTLSVRGGRVICWLNAYDSCVINLYEGSLGTGFWLGDRSTLNIYGGSTNVLLSNSGLADTATLNIFGTQFAYDPLAIPPDEMTDGISRLDFVGLDGQAYYLMGIPDPAAHPNIHLIPEPCTVALLGIGALMLRQKKSMV